MSNVHRKLPISNHVFFSGQYSLSFQHFINLSQVLFAESRWDELVLEFRASNYELHHLHADSLLSTVLQSGLSAIKTHQCYRYLNCRGHTLTFQNAPVLQVLKLQESHAYLPKRTSATGTYRYSHTYLPELGCAGCSATNGIFTQVMVFSKNLLCAQGAALNMSFGRKF